MEDKTKQQFLIEFGRRIRELRARRGYSQESLAHIAGLDRSYLGAIERGENNVTVLNAYKISLALGVEVRDLFEAKKVASGKGVSCQ